MGDRGDVDFLKRVGSHHRGAHLPGERNERHVVHQGIHDAGDEIGRARARGRDTHTDAPRRASVSAGGEYGGGLVTNENVLDVVIVERIVERHDGAPRISEHRFDAQCFERIQND